jgi:hypothetical protein
MKDESDNQTDRCHSVTPGRVSPSEPGTRGKGGSGAAHGHRALYVRQKHSEPLTDDALEVGL